MTVLLTLRYELYATGLMPTTGMFHLPELEAAKRFVLTNIQVKTYICNSWLTEIRKLYKSRQSLEVRHTSVLRVMIGHSPGHQSSTSVVVGRQQMSEIALPHGITLLLSNCTAIASIANKQSVYKWNVGIWFEVDEERNLKVRKGEHEQSNHVSHKIDTHMLSTRANFL